MCAASAVTRHTPDVYPVQALPHQTIHEGATATTAAVEADHEPGEVSMRHAEESVHVWVIVTHGDAQEPPIG